MSKIKQLSILIIFFSLIFLLTGCGPHDRNGDNAPPIKSLPKDLTKLLEEKSGVNFAYVQVHPKKKYKSVLFSRQEYEIEKLDTTLPVPVTELNGQATYSKTTISTGNTIKINNVLFSHCDYVNIGSNANLICQTNKESEYLSKNTENDVIPEPVVQKIEDEIGDFGGWMVLKSSKESKLMRKAGYVIFDASTVFDTKATMDLSQRLNVKTIFFRENPCKCIVDDGDIVYVVYKIICP